jgi:hypothetical protein
VGAPWKSALGSAALATLAALAFAAPGAAAKPAPRVLVPAPGKTTVAVAQLKVTGKAPRGLKLRLKHRAGLGRARGIYAIYRKRRGRTTIFTVFNLILNPAKGPAARNAEAAASDADGSYAHMEFFFVAAGFRDESVFEDHDPKADLAFKLIAKVIGTESETMPSPSFLDLMLEGGVKTPSDEDPFDLGNSFTDTGHYDDGHSFGWNSSGTKAAVADWLHLSNNNAPYEELIEKIESRLKSDLDGDGEVSDGRGSGGTIETEVGVPVVS